MWGKSDPPSYTKRRRSRRSRRSFCARHVGRLKKHTAPDAAGVRKGRRRAPAHATAGKRDVRFSRRRRRRRVAATAFDKTVFRALETASTPRGGTRPERHPSERVLWNASGATGDATTRTFRGPRRRHLTRDPVLDGGRARANARGRPVTAKSSPSGIEGVHDDGPKPKSDAVSRGNADERSENPRRKTRGRATRAMTRARTLRRTRASRGRRRTAEGERETRRGRSGRAAADVRTREATTAGRSASDVTIKRPRATITRLVSCVKRRKSHFEKLRTKKISK